MYSYAVFLLRLADWNVTHDIKGVDEPNSRTGNVSRQPSPGYRPPICIDVQGGRLVVE